MKLLKFDAYGLSRRVYKRMYTLNIDKKTLASRLTTISRLKLYCILNEACWIMTPAKLQDLAQALECSMEYLLNEEF